jgi:hypothetical protein
MADQAEFIHMVFFWLREDGEPGDAEKIAQGCRTYLTDIPGVLRLEVGFPAGTPRAVVDNSYGVALIVEFADREAHDIYQKHPDHLRFIEVYGPLWSRVQIYDALVGEIPPA